MGETLKPRVAVLHVGGTIGMTRSSAGGYRPEPGVLAEHLRAWPELADPTLPEIEITRLDPLIDSADARPRDWLRIAAAVAQRYDDAAGFVVLHGTDTMAYTASALSFLLPGLAKPVILTGSQLPLGHVRSDGREHVITSLLLAAHHAIPEVAIYFGATLLRGNRAQKVHNQDFVAFRSPNLAPLARVGAEIEVRGDLVRPPGAGIPHTVGLAREPSVIAVRLFPGLDAALLARLLEPPVEAVVLETYGTGNAPSRDAAFLAVLERAVTTRDVVVVNCSQCQGGTVRQERYQTGLGLARAGVVSGGDLTAEAALTKLYVLLGSGVSPADTRAAVRRDLAGELTIEPD